MKNRILFSIMILLISSKIFGQVDFYLDFSGTYPFIPKMEQIVEPSYTDPSGNITNIKFTEDFKVKPGFNLEFGFGKKIINRISFNSGIGFSFYQFKRESKVDFTWNNKTYGNSFGQSGETIGIFYGMPPGDVRFQNINSDSNVDATMESNSNFGKTKILYLAIPLRIQYSLVPDRFKIGIGVVNYFVTTSSQINRMIDRGTYPISQKEYNDKSSNGLNNYQLNGNFCLEYRLFRGIWIKSGYNHGFMTVYNMPQESEYPVPSGKAKYRTFDVGLKYIL